MPSISWNWSRLWVLNLFWLAFLGDFCLQPKMAKKNTTAGCRLASRDQSTTSSLIQRSSVMCCCVLEAIEPDLPFWKQLALLCCHFRSSYYEVEILPPANYCFATNSLLPLGIWDLAENEGEEMLNPWHHQRQQLASHCLKKQCLASWNWR